MQDIPLIDQHEDLILHMNRRDLFPKNQWQTNPDMIRNNKLKLVVATAFPIPPHENFLDPVSNEMIEHEFYSYEKLCVKENWIIVKTRDDIDRVLKSDGPIGLILHIEGLNVFDEHNWNQLERWYDKGWRSLGPVWNLKNPLGGGANDLSNGLTELGANVIRWCLKKNMIVDLAHMNEQTFWDATKIIDRPLYVSHGNSRALCNSPRNYSDEQLRAIAKTDGVIGVFFARTYLTGKGKPSSINDVIAHIKHIIKIAGEDAVAVGTDFGGIISGLPEGLESLNALPSFIDALMSVGFTEEVIEKICNKNSARVLKSYL
ncbi:membrane dipeptidase [Candidatus Uhrbacteria bacterium]|nr:membrane dipeptidase [Candidatus Uhrbacteria bacterium]